ncbi:MAG: diacylglycerol/lipid kinase family protein [Actinomycetota bacterium]
MRALLVVNPAATATTPRTRGVILSALAHDLKVEVVETDHRGHARQLGRRATEEGLDLVLALGGDGTVNEVVNGLLTHGPHGGVPDLGVLPGGSTNVFVRALGLPRDPVEATGMVLTAVREGTRRTIGLGRAGPRWFTFSAGLGFDAEVVRAVEEHRGEGRRSSPALYLREAVRVFFRELDRSTPPLRLERSGLPPVDGLFVAIVSNAAPWTFLGERPVNPSPAASFDLGLDLFGLRSLRTATTLRHVRQLIGGVTPHGPAVLALHDQTRFVLTADRPVAFQVDGDYVGTADRVEFQAFPGAIRVLA